MIGLAYRVVIMLINIFFPPLAVMMLTGLNMDTGLNCMFFLLAVIPSHIHGFYISCTYFHRRHKVRKGRYPGGPKSLIYSTNVINGGASNAEVARLYRKERGPRRASSRNRGLSLTREPSDRRPEMGERFASGHGHRGSNSKVTTRRRARGWGAQDGYVAMDGYGSGRL